MGVTSAVTGYIRVLSDRHKCWVGRPADAFLIANASALRRCAVSTSGWREWAKRHRRYVCRARVCNGVIGVRRLDQGELT